MTVNHQKAVALFRRISAVTAVIATVFLSVSCTEVKNTAGDIFTPDITTTAKHIVYPCVKMDKSAYKVFDTVLDNSDNSAAFAQEIAKRKIGDFEKDIDQMCHVSTFIYANDNIYVTYYANTQNGAENPDYQVARLAYAPENDPENKTVIDIMAAGDKLHGHKIVQVYDTIMMRRDDEPDTIYVMWTAMVDDQYYRLYRTFDIKTAELGPVGVNRFQVGDTVNDFSTSGIQNALAVNGKGYKEMRSDIGIMQKVTTRKEHGVKYYYTGSYSGNFNCIIKSKDLITWEYVAQPDEGNGAFRQDTLWENAVYVLDNKAYYCVRQWQASVDEDTGATIPGANRNEWGSDYAILTYYDLEKESWAKPVLIGDSQSRSDFIFYQGNLYLFHAPHDRNHIGIIKINTKNLEKSKIVLQAHMKESCFYPFVSYDADGKELCMSYTVDRKHIRLARFTLSKYVKK